jgi:xanthine dehydrogenase accessory factor
MAVVLPRVLVVGGGEVGSAASHRLFRSGMQVFIVDQKTPSCIRQGVCFAMARLEGSKEVEGVVATKADSAAEAIEITGSGGIPVLAGDANRVAADLKPEVFVDARMLKRDHEALKGRAPLVVGLGPGFVAGKHVDVVIETKRGHDLGRVIYRGSAAAPTGVPGDIGGFTSQRVIRAPAAGHFESAAEIGRMVTSGQVVGRIDASVPVVAKLDGLLRGLVADGTAVRESQKIGDVDPRGLEIDPNTISDRARAIAGGVLEAIMHWVVSQHD